MFLGAASQRTRNIRLGHGVIQLTTNHPVRVAEKVSTLDLLSGGRVELGLGEAQGPVELHPFGVQVRSKRDRWIEGVKATIPLFTETAFEFSGEFYSYPKRNVVPKPLQKPHPPLWVACSNIDTIEDAGRWGMGALGLPVRLAGGGQGLGQPLLPQPHPQSRQDLRLPGQPQHRHGLRLHVLRDG